MIFNKNGVLYKSSYREKEEKKKDQKENWTPEPDCFEGIQRLAVSNIPSNELRFSISITFLMQLEFTQYKCTIQFFSKIFIFQNVHLSNTVVPLYKNKITFPPPKICMISKKKKKKKNSKAYHQPRFEKKADQYL